MTTSTKWVASENTAGAKLTGAEKPETAERFYGITGTAGGEAARTKLK
jgi:hypothetical protein